MSAAPAFSVRGKRVTVAGAARSGVAAAQHHWRGDAVRSHAHARTPQLALVN